MAEISELLERNKIFAKKMNHNALVSLSLGQKPHTAILACSDSRVVPEFIFNCNLGELFVVRVAGNVAADACILASLEYAIGHLGCKNLIILGHTNCGAVSAACLWNSKGKSNLAKLVSKITPAVKTIKKTNCNEGELDSASIENVRLQAKNLLKASLSIRKAVKERKINLALALYELKTGKVKTIRN